MVSSTVLESVKDLFIAIIPMSTLPRIPSIS